MSQPTSDPEFQLASVFDVMADAIGIHEAGRLVTLNPSCLALFGYTDPNELLGRSLLVLIASEEHPRVTEFVSRRGTNEPPPTTYVTKGLRRDGSKFDLDISVARLHVGGQPYFIVRMRDVTGERATSRALHESEERYRTLTMELQVGVLIQGPSAEILLSNPKALELLGLSEAQLRGTTSFDPSWNVIHEDGTPFPGPTHPVPQAIATRRAVTDVVMGVFRPSSEDRVWLLVNAHPQMSPDESVAQVVCTFADITERKRIEEELQRVLRERAVILDDAPVGMALLVDRKHVWVNRWMVKTLGYPLEAFLGQTTRRLYPSEEAYEARGRRAYPELAEGGTFETDEVLVRRDGTRLWAHCVGRNLDPTNPALGSLWIITDTTEQTQAAEALRQSEARFRSLFEGHSAVMLLVDPTDGAIVDANPAAASFYGYAQPTLRSMNIAQINQQPLGVLEQRTHDAELHQSHTFSFRHRLSDGSLRMVEVDSSPVEVEGRRLLFSIVQDVTERERAATALAEVNERLDQALAQSQLAYWEMDAETRTFTFNDRFYRLYATTAEREGGYRMSAEVYAREFLPPEEMHLVPADIAGLRDGVIKELRREHRIRRRDGELRHILVRISAIRDGDGAFDGTQGSSQDITERKEVEIALEELNANLADRVRVAVAELRDRDQLLTVQNRHAAMGEMIGNIAHQWRQPLNALGLVLANLKDAADFGELDDVKLAKTVVDGNALIQKMSATINDFRNFFQPVKEKRAFSALAQIRETIGLIEASFKQANVALELEAPSDLQLFGLPNEYSQVLMNLLTNARQAVQSANVAEGKVAIRLRARDGLACLTVTDNGGGVPESLLPRLGEPYLTTKEGGTGLGIYMSRQIVQQSIGGRLEVGNVEGGAEFTLLTPLASATGVAGSG
jgi:PAS domain S-box-containing protein